VYSSKGVSIILGDSSCWTTATLGGGITVVGMSVFTAATITEGKVGNGRIEGGSVAATKGCHLLMRGCFSRSTGLGFGS
jgi:hypothetical protein